MVGLIILDGWGIASDPSRSAIDNARTPVMNELRMKYPNSSLLTHGEKVGLPEGQMGNSEVGHLNIGAGRIVYQDLAKINKEIANGSLAKNRTLKKAFERIGEGKTLHLMGLVSDGGVHSHIDHLKALIDLAEDGGVQSIFVHAFLDGRDTDPKSGYGFIQSLLQHIKGRNAQLSTVIGRYYAMDRDKRWERTRKAYDLLVKGQAENVTDDILSAIRSYYEEGITDEFIPPILSKTSASNLIEEGDTVLFFNFRTDRPRQLTEVLSQKDYPEFGMKRLGLNMVTMANYDQRFKKVEVLFEKENLTMTLGEVLEKRGLAQLRIAETEKYPHVTFFFSGGREEPFAGEDRILVPSPKVATYDLKPEMSAEEITTQLCAYTDELRPDFFCLNFANTDMVGHTGVFSAAVKAAETVDACLGKILKDLGDKDYAFIIIADHGNSDYMINDDGSPNTAHSINPVPCILVPDRKDRVKVNELSNGILADVAPTVLKMMAIPQPKEMTGKALY